LNWQLETTEIRNDHCRYQTNEQCSICSYYIITCCRIWLYFSRYFTPTPSSSASPSSRKTCNIDYCQTLSLISRFGSICSRNLNKLPVSSFLTQKTQDRFPVSEPLILWCLFPNINIIHDYYYSISFQKLNIFFRFPSNSCMCLWVCVRACMCKR